jgi:MraZ protein
MFLGQYTHTVDEKGRLTIPIRYRDLLADGGFLTKGFDHNLMVLSTSSFTDLTMQANDLSVTDQDSRMMIRLLYSNAVQVEFDKLGRLVLPQFLREMVDIQTNVVIAGVGGFFEIWSEDRWRNQHLMMKDSEKTAQQFMAFSLKVK